MKCIRIPHTGAWNKSSVECIEAEFGEDSEDVVADAGNNADLYAANQGSTELINEAHTEEAATSH